MDLYFLTRGLLYLFLPVFGIPGNCAVIWAFLLALRQEGTLLPADAIVLHLACANLLAVSSRCVFEILANFQVFNPFNDPGCKGIYFIFRTFRGLSIWLTFTLSSYQCLSIAPPGSHWATLRSLFGRYLWLIFLLLWIINTSASIPTLFFAVAARNDSKLLENSINIQFCFINFPSVYVKEANGAAQVVRDVFPMSLMTTASFIILVFLYRHSRQGTALRSGAGTGGGGASAERRAAISVVVLVTFYVLMYGVDNGLWVYTLTVKQTLSSALISDLRIFFSLVFAAISPIIIITTNMKVKKQLQLCREEK